MSELYVVQFLVFPKLIISGPSEAIVGTNVSIECIIEKGRPSPNIHIITPSGELNTNSEIIFTATLNNTGNYTCVGSTALITVAVSHLLLVTATYINTTKVGKYSVQHK